MISNPYSDLGKSNAPKISDKACDRAAVNTFLVWLDLYGNIVKFPVLVIWTFFWLKQQNMTLILYKWYYCWISFWVAKNLNI